MKSIPVTSRNPQPVTWQALLDPYRELAAGIADRLPLRLGLSAEDVRDILAVYCSAFVATLIFVA